MSSSSSSSSSASSSSASSFSLPPRLVSVSQPYSSPALPEAAPTPTIPIINTAFPFPSSLSPSDAQLSIEPLTSATEALRMSVVPTTSTTETQTTTTNGILPRRGLGKLPLIASQIIPIPERQDDQGGSRKPPVQLKLNGALNALAASPDMDFAVVAGREVLKILAINDHEIKETVNLRIGSRLNLNFSSNDVKWGNGMTKQKIATAATNGAVVIWDLTRANQKLERIISEHTRAVNRICFHPSNGSILLSGSQDGTMKLWDLRVKSYARYNFEGKAESVRDVQFNSVNPNEFAAAFENGTIQRWDIRNPNNYERKLSAHNGLALTVDWHPDGRLVASGGRDRMIKVWDMKSDSRKPVHHINTIASVARVSWRPGHDMEIASCSLLTDCRVHIWDVRRPYISKYHLDEHESVPTGLLWTDQDVLWTCAKDRYVIRNEMNRDTYRPLDHLSGMGMAWNVFGDLMSVAAGRGNRGEERLDVWEENFHPSSSPGILPTPSSALSTTSSGGLAGISNTTAQSQRLNKGGNGTVARRAGAGIGVEPRPLPLPRQVSSILSLPISFRPDPFILMAQNYSISPTHLRHACERNSLVAWAAGEYRTSQTWRIVEMLFDEDSKYEIAASKENDTGTGKYATDTFGDGDGFASESKEDPTRAEGLKGREEDDGDRNFAQEEERGSLTMPSHDVYVPNGDYALLTPERSLDGSDDSPFFSSVGTSRRRKKWPKLLSTFMGDDDDEEEEEEEEEEENKILDGKATRDSNRPEPSSFERNGTTSGDSSFDPASRPTTMTSSLYPKWNHSRIVQDLLVYYAEKGDVQMCVTLRLVLGDRAEIPDHVLGHKEEEWFWGYIDLLHRFQLYSAAASIISACKIPSVRQRSQESTTIHTTCNNCFKALISKEKRVSDSGMAPSGFWMCESCRKLVNPCSLCHQTVRGLYVWCQGCSHGGHLRCLQKWFEDDAEFAGLEGGNCPTGCGHVCVFRKRDIGASM